MTKNKEMFSTISETDIQDNHHKMIIATFVDAMGKCEIEDKKIQGVLELLISSYQSQKNVWEFFENSKDDLNFKLINSLCDQVGHVEKVFKDLPNIFPTTQFSS